MDISKFKKKYYIFVISILVILAILVMSISINHFKTKLEQNYNVSLKMDANKYEEIINNYMNLIKVNITNIGYIFSSFEDINLIQEQDNKMTMIQNIFASTTQEIPIVDRIYFIRHSDGLCIDENGAVFNTTDTRKNPWYQNSYYSKFILLSAIYTDHNTQQPVITLSYAIQKDHHVIGVLAADIFLSDFYTVLQSSTIGRPEEMYILDQEDNIIYCTNSNQIGQIYDYQHNNAPSIINIMYDLSWHIHLYKDMSYLNNELSNFIVNVVFLSIIFLGILLFLLNLSLNNALNKDNKLDNCFTKNQLVKFIATHNTGKNFHFLYIDIKNFSLFNSKYSQKAGDKLLNIFAKTIVQLFEKAGFLIHFKDDDFIYVFENGDFGTALYYTKKLLNQLNSTPFTFDNISINVNAIMWLSNININFKKEIDNLEQLFRLAIKTHKDEQLIIEEFSPIWDIAQKNQTLKMELMDALETDQIFPFFQPVSPFKQETYLQFEVLMRIKKGDKYLSPFPYIQIAEQQGLIEKVDLIVMEKTLSYISKLENKDDIRLSFNVSALCIVNNDFMYKIINLVDQFNILHQNIIIEITETQSIEDLDSVAKIIDLYKENGFSISIDDFGTGYASMYYLNKVSADILKIDGSFITDICTNKKNRYLIEAIVKIAKAYGMKTVAEYVESEEIYHLLKTIGVDLMQGYYLGKPKKEI